MDMLFDSVAPEVKTMSLGSAPMRSAMCCGEGRWAKSLSQKECAIDIPSWPPRRLFQPPNRKRGFGCVGFRIGPSCKGAWRRVLEGPQASSPEQNSVKRGTIQCDISNLHIQIDRSDLVLQTSLSAGCFQLKAKNIWNGSVSLARA